MTLENKLGLTNSAELALAEEKITKQKALQLFSSRITKQKALQLFSSSFLNTLPAGTFETLAAIHQYLFEDVYAFAGKMRTVNIAKGSFRFVPALYLPQALNSISQMPQSSFDEIIAKYVEMNVAHPFREGNGRSTRIWLESPTPSAKATGAARASGWTIF